MKRWISYVVATCLVPVALGHTAADPASEYEVKAAFLLNFVKYVDWPSGSLAGADDRLSIVVVGTAYADLVEQALQGKTVKGHSVSLRRYADARDVDRCHVLYFMADATSQLRSAARTLAGKPVLTISEAEKSEVTEAVINFIAVETRLGFSINLDAADSANLRVSSRLLSLAHSVRSTRAQR